MQPIGILGGTFDPIHIGHLAIATQSLQLGIQAVYFVPVNIPPHRHKPIASALQRKEMIQHAIADHNNFYMDERELERNEVSYSIDTIKSFRKDFPDTSLCMIMGKDAFNQIDKWHKWDSLLDYVHIIVADRSGGKLSIGQEMENWVSKHVTNKIETLKQKQYGSIYFMPTTLIDASSSDIRLAIKNNDPLDNYLHASTIDFIHKQHLYQDN